jgi:antitoxin (DNA-binding transcriptional repressor) of toxin-antitoxin stability system
MLSLMRSITVKEAENSFARMLEAASRGGVVLREGGKDVAAVVSMSDAEMLRKAKALAAIKARNGLASDAQAKGLTEDILAEILDERA